MTQTERKPPHPDAQYTQLACVRGATELQIPTNERETDAMIVARVNNSLWGPCAGGWRVVSRRAYGKTQAD